MQRRILTDHKTSGPEGMRGGGHSLTRRSLMQGHVVEGLCPWGLSCLPLSYLKSPCAQHQALRTPDSRTVCDRGEGKRNITQEEQTAPVCGNGQMVTGREGRCLAVPGLIVSKGPRDRDS